MTATQQRVFQLIKSHIAALAHWSLVDVESQSDGTVTFRLASEKWYNDSVMGTIGKRGAFTQWTLDSANNFKAKRQNLKIILDVYVR